MHAVLGRGRVKFVCGDDSFTSMIPTPLVIQPISNTLLSMMQHYATCESLIVAVIFLTCGTFPPFQEYGWSALNSPPPTHHLWHFVIMYCSWAHTNRSFVLSALCNIYMPCIPRLGYESYFEFSVLSVHKVKTNRAGTSNSRRVSYVKWTKICIYDQCSVPPSTRTACYLCLPFKLRHLSLRLTDVLCEENS